MSADGTDVGPGQLVNKAELARVLGCSRPTVGDLITRYPDLPVKQRGDLSREWLFDAKAVVDFLSEKRRQEAEEADRREEFLSGFKLPFDDDQQPAGLSQSQRLAAARAALLEHKVAIERGQLVIVSELRQSLTAVAAHLGQFFDRLPREIGRQHNLPGEVIRSIEKQLDQARHNFADELQKAMGDHAVDR